ncbi:2',3'-cyclic-nucleotide 2'-phosphodiesterase / 3'-nucleotidase [Anaerosphaera aminiphila DSM 21120]|uniref:2',3'-cyclic-nucleotide 2'-phosphodiesterase / 3'-nucleotidase n=1 Tax=Anaerosphaera aminiphila DSM 21120 TaxID=1120995 RepID=A0A1M5PVZ8_9FIRM|nr:bifunctional UDP-sugar hydrolase/5'-nucleotidase [Anaerosphaera aminiphila]SHH05619.1 2',3'-cyclic-nucleotide 2'-phosphodiesterase / 3'-nucleotidase [Anaerosphaera aminiphila DSM 21120]
MKINIYATSDVHGHIYPYDYAANCSLNHSLAHIYSCYEEDKTEYKLIVDNGDIIQGNFAELFIDEVPNPVVNVMNNMNYSIWNMGNHEFNFSFPKLKKIISNFNGTALMANSNSAFFNKYKTVKIGGIKISFIGINTVLINEFEKEESLAGLVIENPVPILNKLIKELANESDILIGMFHMGLQDENSVPNSGLYSVLDNINSPQLFDVIVCGHTHKDIEELFYKNILITETSAYANTVSKIELEFDEKKLINKNSKLVDLSNFNPSEKILKLYEPYHKKILEYTNETIGYVSGIVGNFNYDLEDNPLNHLLTEIMLQNSKADVVAFQIDNKNAVLKNGPLKRYNMAKLYSYDGGEVTSYKITGLDLKTYIIWSYDYFDYSEDTNSISVNEKRALFKYKTLDVFGNINYAIDLKKQGQHRLIELKYLNGIDVLDSDEIIIGMNEYRMNFLISKKGPLNGKTFDKTASTKYIDKHFHKRGTIRELAEDYFNTLLNKTYIYDNKVNFLIKY